MTAAAAAETRMSHRVTRVRVAPVPAPRSLSRQVRDNQNDIIEQGALARRMTVAVAAETRSSHRMARVTAALAAVLTSLSCEIRDGLHPNDPLKRHKRSIEQAVAMEPCAIRHSSCSQGAP